MSAPAVRTRWALGLGMVAVVAVTAFGLPDDGGSDPASTGARAPASPSGVMPSETPAAAPTDQTFCASYRALAAVQAEYAASPDDGQGRRLLEEMADDLLATGVPASMDPIVRAGFATELGGIYASLGLTLDRRAVAGAAEDAGDGTSISGPVGAFGRWLAELCPA